jgi:hypothetical protein
MPKPKTAAGSWSYTGGAEAVEVHFPNGIVTFARGEAVSVDAEQAATLADHPEFESTTAAPKTTPNEEA